MAPKKSDAPQEGSRRSTRVADAQKKPRAAATKAKDAVKKAVAPAAAPAKKKPAAKPAAPKKAAAAPKKAAVSKKRTKDEVDEEDSEVEDAEAEEEKPKAKKFSIGDTISADIVLKNEKGEDVNVKELSEKGLVMFLVPKANTPGCTKQACAYRDSYADFSQTGYEVYCLSADSTTSQSKWQTKEGLPYPLLSDPERTLIRALGAGSAGKTTRSHFIFEKGTGKLIDKQVPVVSTKRCVHPVSSVADKP
ncbi:AhpC-TSA-domain-containing protein [Clavulina sp. PMI_390]|nr:AhpC-TSA-domain-containing protein [Clavulina sp. PMI_390]